MELETLKTLWQEQEFAAVQPSKEEWLDLLRKNSHGPITRMRRNLRIELLMMAASYAFAAAFYWFAFNGEFSRVAWLFVGIFLFFAFYYYRKNRLLIKMQCPSCEVRSNLAGQLKTLKKYLRFYFWSSTLIAPLSTIAAFAIALQSRLHDQPPFNWWRGITLLSALVIAVTVGIYYVNRWQIHKLYGRHIRKLQDLLREMDEC